MSVHLTLMSDEEFEALERTVQTRVLNDEAVTREAMHDELLRLAHFARYWRDRAAEDPNMLQELQSTGVG